MAIVLRQSTAGQEVPLGTFLDSTDGNTEEAALTIANTDIKIWKCGATTLASKNSGGATYISNGVYYCVLDGTDTNTPGSGKIYVHVAGALACEQEFIVLTATNYDALIPGTDNLDVNAVQVGGSTQTAADLQGNLALILEDTGTSLPNSIAGLDTLLDSVLEDTGTTLPTTLTTIAGKIDIVDTVVDSTLVDTNLLVDFQVNKNVSTDNGTTVSNVLYADNGSTPLKTRVYTKATGTRAAAT